MPRGFLGYRNGELPRNDDYTITSGAFTPGFSGGETAHITASGAAVPAFATDIAIPLVLLIDSPVPDAKGIITANPASDLVLKFSRGTAGVDLYLQSSGSQGTLICQGASESGTLTIPAEALALSGGTIPLWTFGNKTVTSGDWSIVVGSLMDAYTPDKTHPVTIVFN